MGCNCNDRGSVSAAIIPSPCRHDTCGKCGSGHGTCRCTPNAVQGQPVPFYNQASGCQESHSQVLVNERYSPAVKVSSSFSVVAGGLVNIVIPNLTDVVIGSYLWNPLYGYLKITAFDYASSTVTVQNIAATGVMSVPSCTFFIVTDGSSVSNIPASIYPFVALDFTAPAVGNCLLITVTNTNGLVVGKNIQILSGIYRVSALNSATTITICNDGAGLTPGSAVIAQDGSGNYVVPISLIDANQCTNPAVAAGSLIVCNNGISQPLDAALNGQVPVVTDAVNNTVEFKTLDIPALNCTTLDVCLEMHPGVTTYIISVVSNVGFALNEIIQLNTPGLELWRFIITNIDPDTHHMTISISNGYIPPANYDIDVGTAVCASSCCEQLAQSIIEVYDYVNDPCSSVPFRTALSAMLSPKPVVGCKIHTTLYGALTNANPTLFLNGGSSVDDQWLEIEIANPSCLIARAVLSAHVQINTYSIASPFESSEFHVSPQLGWDVFATGGSSGRPWLFNSPACNPPGANCYTQNPDCWVPAYQGWNQEVLPPPITPPTDDEMIKRTVTLRVPFFWDYLVAPGNSIRVAIRPQLQIDGLAPSFMVFPVKVMAHGVLTLYPGG